VSTKAPENGLASRCLVLSVTVWNRKIGFRSAALKWAIRLDTLSIGAGLIWPSDVILSPKEGRELATKPDSLVLASWGNTSVTEVLLEITH